MLTCVAEATTTHDVAMAALDDLRGLAPLKLSHRIRPTGEAVMELSGELDVATAERAVSYVTDLIERHHGPVTADLTALAFCDAQGLAALVRMANYAEQTSRLFRLAAPSPSLMKLLRITGLDRRFLTAPAAAALSTSNEGPG